MKLPKIAKPRPLQWREPLLWGNAYTGFYVGCLSADGNHYRSGPYRKTGAAAIRAWNLQERKK